MRKSVLSAWVLAFLSIALIAQFVFAQDSTRPTTAPLTQAEKDALIQKAVDLSQSGTAKFQAGDIAGALADFQADLALRIQAAQGEDNADLAVCMNNVAYCLQTLGHYDQALQFYERALAMQRRLSKGGDNLDVVTTLGDVGSCLDALGRSVEALPNYKEAMEMERRLCDNQDDPNLATCMNNMAYCLQSVGRSDEALPIYQAALEMRKRIYKDQDSEAIATSLNNLAYCLVSLGRDADALPIYKDALGMWRRLFKDQDNADVATALNNIALCYDDLGKFDEALPIYQQALDMRRRVFKGADNTDLAESLNNMAACLEELGRNSEALPIFQAALEMRRRIFQGQDHPDMAESLNNLASCMDSMGRAADALPLYRAALEMRLRIYRDMDHPEVAESLNNVAYCLVLLGRNAEALPMYQAALAMRQRVYKNADHPDVANSLNNLASCLDTLGRGDGALKLYQAALEMRQRIYKGQDHPDVAGSLNNVAASLESQGRHAEALVMFKSALAMQKRIFRNQDHPDIAISLSNVGYCLDALGRPAEALSSYQAALEMEERVYNNHDHPQVARSMNNVATCLNSLGRFDEALSMFQNAVAMAERLNDPGLYQWTSNLGAILLETGDPGGAAKAFETSIDSLEKARQSLGGDDQDRMGFMSVAAGWGPFSGMVRAQIQLQQANRAVEYLDQGKARGLLDMLERAEVQGGGDVLRPVEEAARESHDTAKLAEIEKARQDLAAADDAVRELTAMIGQARALNNEDGYARIQELAPKLKEAEGNYADMHRRFFDLAGEMVAAKPVSALQVQSLLKEHQHLLMFSITDSDAVVLVVPPSGQAITGTYLTEADGTTRLSGKDLKKAIAEFRDTVVAEGMEANRGVRVRTKGPTTKPQENAADRGYALFSSLLPPEVWKEIQDDQVVYVVPDAAMSGLPMEMLVIKKPSAGNEPTYWIDEGPPVVYGPSAAALLDRAKVRDAQVNGEHTHTHDIVLLGDPVLQRDQNQPRIPVPSAGAWVASVKSGSNGEAIGLCPGAIITAYGSFEVGGKDQFEAATDKLLVQNFHKQLADIPKLKFWLDGQMVERPLSLNDPGIEVMDLTPDRAKQSAEGQSTTLVALRDASLTRYGALAPLPGTRTEVEGIYKVFTGHDYSAQGDDRAVVLLGKDATGPQLFEAAPGSRYLHLATHGLVESGEEAIYSSVVLSQPQVVTPQDTGLLTLGDLFDHWWGKLNGTELVVLSACDSQGLDETQSNAIAGEGVFGLPWGFMYAGTPAVIASDWEVQDQSTAKLMERFYAELRDTPEESKLKAFVTARRELKKAYPLPFYWAPFIYLGDPR